MLLEKYAVIKMYEKCMLLKIVQTSHRLSLYLPTRRRLLITAANETQRSLPVDFLLSLNRIIFRRNNGAFVLEKDDAATAELHQVRSRDTIGSEITRGRRKGNAKQNVARMGEKCKRNRGVEKSKCR